MDLSAMVQQCTPAHVAPQNMRAIMTIESSHNPWAIGYKVVRRSDRKVFHLNVKPTDKAQAVAWAKWFDTNGFVYDAGPLQVNSSNFKKYGLTYETVFDPCPNIRTGALIFADCYARALPRRRDEQSALRDALSCYQSGNFSTGYSTGYVQKVVAAATSKQASR